MIYYGDTPVQRLFLGDNEISEVYRGGSLVWRKGGAGKWRFEFQGRSGIYDLHTYAEDNGQGRIEVEKTTFPFSAGHEYPGLYFVTGNPVQYSSHTIFHLKSGLISTSEPDEILIEIDLFLVGADNGAWSVSLFDGAVGMVFDKTGLEAGLRPRLWCGQYEETMRMSRVETGGPAIGGYPAGRAALWVSPEKGFVRAYLGNSARQEVTFDPRVFNPSEPLNVRFENKAAFMLIPTPTWIPTPVPIYPPGIHAVSEYTGQEARRRLAELGWAEKPIEVPDEVDPNLLDPNRGDDDTLWADTVYSTAGSHRVSVPTWARSVQVVALGGGGGGSGGDLLGSNACRGGQPGQWASGVLTDLPSALSIHVGAGGAAGPSVQPGAAGVASWVRTGNAEIKGAGGAGGSGYGDPAGLSPGTKEFFGRQYVGGAVAWQTEPGHAPGGGGGAADTKPIGRRLGGNGGAGKIWLRFSSKP